MSEEMLVMHCSPTLAGLKTGNLFSCSYRDREEVLGFLRHWNTTLREKGIRLIPLRFKNGKALIYVYRPSKLNKDFRDDGVCQLLAQQGYCTDSCQQCIVRLIHKLRESAEFPHEIWLFLGYPCEDVKGFIENKAARAKCVGCWKVYGDCERAQRTFQKLRKCSEVYRRHWRSGASIDRLTVPENA